MPSIVHLQALPDQRLGNTNWALQRAASVWLHSRSMLEEYMYIYGRKSVFLRQSWHLVCQSALPSSQDLHSRLRVANDSLHAVCSLIKDELEPHMRDFSPSVVNGLYFERLSFGLVPMSIMGVRIVPQSHSGQNVAIGAEAQPDPVCLRQ